VIFPRVGDGPNREDYPVLDGNKQRIVWLIKPRHEEFRGFVPEPSLQNSPVIPMISQA
jgi:hypothetical protein